MAEQASKAVNKQVAGEEFTNTHHAQDSLTVDLQINNQYEG